MTNSTASFRLRRVGFAAFALFSVLLFASAAQAQEKGVGVRAGVSSDPDQFYFGAHLDTGFLFERVSFRPNVEIGVGNNLTTVAGNFEFAYWWKLPSHPWQIYAGGGPAVNFYKVGDNGPFSSYSETDPGFNLLLGAAHRSGFFAEIKVGLIDSPDFKFGVGYTWK